MRSIVAAELLLPRVKPMYFVVVNKTSRRCQLMCVVTLGGNSVPQEVASANFELPLLNRGQGRTVTFT